MGNPDTKITKISRAIFALGFVKSSKIQVYYYEGPWLSLLLLNCPVNSGRKPVETFIWFQVAWSQNLKSGFSKSVWNWIIFGPFSRSPNLEQKSFQRRWDLCFLSQLKSTDFPSPCYLHLSAAFSSTTSWLRWLSLNLLDYHPHLQEDLWVSFFLQN